MQSSDPIPCGVRHRVELVRFTSWGRRSSSAAGTKRFEMLSEFVIRVLNHSSMSSSVSYLDTNSDFIAIGVRSRVAQVRCISWGRRSSSAAGRSASCPNVCHMWIQNSDAIAFRVRSRVVSVRCKSWGHRNSSAAGRSASTCFRSMSSTFSRAGRT